MDILIQDIKPIPILSTSIALIILVLGIFYNNKNVKRKPSISITELNAKLLPFQPEPLAPKEEIYIEPNVSEIVEPLKAQNIQCFNLNSTDYLNFSNNNEIKLIAEKCIRNNGVGSCGPRGFYGSVDIHLDLENRISEFMGLEETVLYSYSVSTMSSAVVAYCKKGDAIFCDEKIAYTTIQGIKAAKAKIIFFKHNDVTDLEEQLIKFNESEANKKIKARKFLFVEGIYKTGKICCLPDLVKIREKYMMRMFLDEYISFGSLGKHGRGVTEHYNINPTDIDLIIGSLEYGVNSIGGFCVGSSFVIEHSRLSGLGYCFSASLPPFLSYIAIHAVDLFEKQSELFMKLHSVSKKVHNALINIPNITVVSDELSPKKVFVASNLSANEVALKCHSKGLIVAYEEDLVSFNINVDMDNDTIRYIADTFSSLAFRTELHLTLDILIQNEEMFKKNGFVFDYDGSNKESSTFSHFR